MPRWCLALAGICLSLVVLEAKKPQPPPPVSNVPWVQLNNFHQLEDSDYTPVVLTPSGIRVFANWNGSQSATLGTWYVRGGTWSQLGQPVIALLPAQISDIPNAYIRTTGVARGVLSGTYYAMLHVGQGYPSPIYFPPAWASSVDGQVWNYQGRVTVDGVSGDLVYGNYADSAHVIVQEDRPPLVDHLNPTNNRFLFWGAFNLGNAVPLGLLYSADGMNWFRHKVNGVNVNMWPVAGDSPTFVTAAKGAFDRFHLLARVNFPTGPIRHLYSCDGINWRVLDMISPVSNPISTKGTNLAYDAVTSTMHALTSGQHWAFVDQGFSC